MKFYVELDKARNIERDEDGVASSWYTSKTLETFTSPVKFTKYVDSNIENLTDVVAFSGSASIVRDCNYYIMVQLKEKGLL